MRIIEINYHIDFRLMMLSESYYFIVEMLDPLQLTLLKN